MLNKKKRFFDRISGAILSLIMITSLGASFCACNSKNTENPFYYEYLGDISYDATETALVLEDIDGEDEKGIVYREITDADGLVNAAGDFPVCLYVYNSIATDNSGITALTEDLAQAFDGQILFIAVDSLSNEAFYNRYEIASIPGYALIKNGETVSVFDGSSYDYWGSDEVIEWFEENGYGI